MFLITDMFLFSMGHPLLTLILVSFTFEKSSILQCRRPTPRRNHEQKHYMFVLSGTRERKVSRTKAHRNSNFNMVGIIILKHQERLCTGSILVPVPAHISDLQV